MADQKRWFKLWHSALSDDALVSLAPAIRWAWAALGAHTKVHGSNGRVLISETNLVLAAQMGVEQQTLREVISTLPHVTVRCTNCARITCDEECTTRHGDFSVTWQNWTKYQEDSTQADRARASRSKRRGEENKKRRSVSAAPDASSAGANGFSAWPGEWDTIRNLVTGESALPFLASYQHWLVDLDWWTTMRALYAPLPLAQLLTDAVGYIQGEGYHPRTKAAIRQKLRNCMEYAAKKTERGRQAKLPSSPDPYTKFPRIS